MILVGNNGILADQERVIRELLKESMESLTDTLTRHISTEIGAAISMRIDDLRDDLGAVRAIKDTTELCLTKVENTVVYIDEIIETVETMNKNTAEVAMKLDTINQDISSSKTSLDSIPQVRTQLSCISARLTEALKVGLIRRLSFFLKF